MSRKCSICGHPQRDEIDKRLARGDSIAGITRDIAGISEDSLARHKESHLPKALVSSQKAEEEARADSILQEVKNLKAKALSLLEKAESSGDLKTALQGIRETRGCLELMARVLGELREQDINVNVSVNVLQSQEWIQIRSSLMEALQPYQEAREAASAALLRIDNRGRNAGR